MTENQKGYQDGNKDAKEEVPHINTKAFEQVLLTDWTDEDFEKAYKHFDSL